MIIKLFAFGKSYKIEQLTAKAAKRKYCKMPAATLQPGRADVMSIPIKNVN